MADPKKVVPRSELLKLLREASALCADEGDGDPPDLAFRINTALAREEERNSFCPTCGSPQEDDEW